MSVVDAGGKNNVPLYVNLADQFDIPCVSLLDDDNEDEDSKDVDKDTVNKCKALSDSFFRLEEDLEKSLLKSISIDNFHDSMERLSEIGVVVEYDEDLAKMEKRS